MPRPTPCVRRPNRPERPHNGPSTRRERNAITVSSGGTAQIAAQMLMLSDTRLGLNVCRSAGL